MDASVVFVPVAFGQCYVLSGEAVAVHVTAEVEGLQHGLMGNVVGAVDALYGVAGMPEDVVFGSAGCECYCFLHSCWIEESGNAAFYMTIILLAIKGCHVLRA